MNQTAPVPVFSKLSFHRIGSNIHIRHLRINLTSLLHIVLITDPRSRGIGARRVSQLPFRCDSRDGGHRPHSAESSLTARWTSIRGQVRIRCCTSQACIVWCGVMWCCSISPICLPVCLFVCLFVCLVL